MQWVDYNIQKIRKWNLPAAIEEKIFGGNATKVLNG